MYLFCLVHRDNIYQYYLLMCRLSVAHNCVLCDSILLDIYLGLLCDIERLCHSLVLSIDLKRNSILRLFLFFSYFFSALAIYEEMSYHIYEISESLFYCPAYWRGFAYNIDIPISAGLARGLDWLYCIIIIYQAVRFVKRLTSSIFCLKMQ